MGSLLTIVIAAYNSERTIEKTLQSLVPLLKKGAQAIVVDDGSKDRTHQIAYDFSTTVIGVEVFSLEHAGSANARNFGLNQVKTKLVMFCDADDELLDFDLNAIESYNADLIVCDYLYSRVDLSIERTRVTAGDLTSKNSSFSAEISSILMKQIGFWRYLYATEFLKNHSIRFVGTLRELKSDYFVLDDYFFLLHALSSYDLVTHWNVPVYKYHENPSASQQRFQKQSKYMARAAIIQIEEMYEKLSRERRRWYRIELRRQLFSSYKAISVSDSYMYWREFGRALEGLREGSEAENFLQRWQNLFWLLLILMRKTASKCKSLVMAKNSAYR